MSEILFVDVLRGAKATIYGSQGAHGVIAIYTKDGIEKVKTSPKIRKGIVNFVHPGYSQTRKFYEPVNKTEQPEHKTPDYRTTIYWKPMVRFNKEGKAKISFYSADIATTYRVELQGITVDGIPIISEMFLGIE